MLYDPPSYSQHYDAIPIKVKGVNLEVEFTAAYEGWCWYVEDFNYVFVDSNEEVIEDTSYTQQELMNQEQFNIAVRDACYSVLKKRTYDDIYIR